MSLLRTINAVLAGLGLRLDGAQTNDGAYWDRYVRRWKADPANSALPFVGSEWHGEDVFLALLREHGGGEALEIGCGGGRITSHAVAWFRHLHAGDPSRQMLRENAERVPAANVSRHLLDGFTLAPFADASLDVVFSHDVFVHFSSLQVYPYLAEIRRVLRPGGVGLLSFYDFHRHFDLFKEMSLDLYTRRVYPPHMRVHFLTEPMLDAMLADLGLTPIGGDTSNFLVKVFRK